MFLVSKALKALFKIRPNATLKIPYGSMKGVVWLVNSANPGQAFGRYEPEHEAQFVALLQGTKVLWDVGAHVGWYSLLAAKHLPASSQVLSFEPNPNNLTYLNQHCELNSANNIKIIEKALCNNVGHAFFSDQAQQSKLEASGQYQVATDTADHFVTPDTTPDFIKLDIEGAEYEFLQGAQELIRRHKPQILLSAHGYKKRDLCTQWLSDQGYNIEHLVANTQEGDYVFLAKARQES